MSAHAPVHQPIDSRVHHAVLRAIVDRGRAPSLSAISDAVGASLDDAAASLHRLHANHGLVLHPGSTAIWLAHPFSLSPTAVWVAAGSRGWWAPCLWCAFGVATLLASEPTPIRDVSIRVRLGGETDDATIEVKDGAVVDGGLIAHFPLPPRRAWDNVIHFCASLLPFRDEPALDDWCSRHGTERGVPLPLPRLQLLARHWYGNHLAPDWIKWTPAQAAAIFASCGLEGPFWALDTTATRF
jgi:alkylmercury lyase-like protein